MSPPPGRRVGVARNRAGEHQRSGAVRRDRSALTAVAARLSAPLALLDVGCSAGINLLCDRFRLDYGPAGATGPVDAPVEIQCAVVGGSPPIAPELPAITARIGLDHAPIDEKERVLLRFVGKVTKNLPAVDATDIAALHAAGWDDEAIYYTITTCALFNFYTRWITASGVPEMSPVATTPRSSATSVTNSGPASATLAAADLGRWRGSAPTARVSST